MGSKNIPEMLKKARRKFLKTASDINENVYLLLFSLYILIYFVINIEWGEFIQPIVSNLRYAILSVVMWGATVYLIYFIANLGQLWKKVPLLCLISVPILGFTAFFSMKMSTNSYGIVMDLFFCIMACGKNYRKMLQIVLRISIVMLLIAAIGVPFGLTEDLIKPDNIHPGHSLGIIYPNTWGDLVYLALIILWYLYLRYRPFITFAVFWIAGAFMFFFIYARTMSFFSFLFPIVATLIDLLQNRYNFNSNTNGNDLEPSLLQSDKGGRTGILGWLVIAIPFISLIFVIFASMQMEWVHKTFYYTWFHNFAMRFVQGGFYLKTYGMPLFGNPYRGNVHTFMYVNGEYLELGNLDSAFVSYIIMRGMVWIIVTLLWLCIANWKALKVKDYAIPFLGTTILLFAMMERIGLEMWYNFILLYPLANVVPDTADKKHCVTNAVKYLPPKCKKKG